MKKLICLTSLLLSIFLMMSVVSADNLFSDDFDGYSSSAGQDLYDEMSVNDWDVFDIGPYNYTDDIYLDDTHTPGDNYILVRDDSSITTSVDTTGYKNIELSYDRRIDFSKSGDSFVIDWRVGDSDPWTPLENVTSDSWSVETWSLSGAENEAEIQIRFLLNDGNGDHGLLDDVFVTGDESVAPIIVVDAEPEYPTCSSGITVCATVTDNSTIDFVDISCTAGSKTLTASDVVASGDEYCEFFSASSMSPADAMDLICTIEAEDEFGNNETSGPATLATYDCADPEVDFTCSPLSGDEDLEVTCNASATDTVDDDLDYYWTFGDGQTSTGENPIVTYLTDGNYTVTLMATDDANHSTAETKVGYIKVLDIGPDTSFDEDKSNFGESETVSFTDTTYSHDPILSWSWSFGDGEFSSEQNTTHVYADNGTYNVTLKVCDEDNDCDTAMSTMIVNNEAPVPNAGEYTCDETDVITLTATFDDVAGDGPWVVEWDFDGDEVFNDSTGLSVSYTCGDGDDYIDGDVTVKVTDKDGASGVDDAQINISNVAPTANANGPYETAVGNSVCLDGSATDAIDTAFTYQWDFDYNGTFDTNSTSEDPCTSYSVAGVYTVAVRANDGDDWSDVATSTVTVYEYGIDLNTGWNLMSIPLVPEDDDTSIGNVFGGAVLDNAEVVWSYQNGVWKYNRKLSGGDWSTSGSRVQDIFPGWGYYVKMTNDTTLYQNGKDNYGVGADMVPMPPRVDLVRGWNLIGHYGMESKPVYCSLSSLIDTTIGYPRWSALFSYNASSNSFVSLNTDAETNFGVGYWVEMDVDDGYNPTTTCMTN